MIIIDHTYSKRCIAYKNKKSNCQCTNKVTKNGFVCGIHKKSNTIINNNQAFHLYWNNLKFNNNQKNKLEKFTRFFYGSKISYNLSIYLRKWLNKYKYLDSHFDYCLLGGEDSWKDIPAHRRFFIDESSTWWDLSFLLNHMIQQLNQCSMGSSYPVFPSDPFTRQKYSIELIKKIKKRIDYLKWIVPNVLQIFLSATPKKLKSFDNSNKIRKYFDIKLRYKMINQTDSQSNYIGIWVDKFNNLDNFELLYMKYIKMSPYIYQSHRIINNTNRINIKKKMDLIKNDYTNLTQIIML